MSRFVVFPKWAAELCALWVVHTYAYERRPICTYIAIESPDKECGKSTLITVLSHLVERPIVSANITSPAFFRLIEEFKPSLLIDEAELNLRCSRELRAILNAGYSKPNAFVWRVTYDPLPDDQVPTPDSEPQAGHDRGGTRTGRLARYTCWCPKAVASIGRLHDTVVSRCITIRMHRKTDKEVCERLKRLDATDLKRQCARFVLDHADAIAAAEPPIPAGLTNRAADIWEPLLAIADLAGGRWPDLARQAALALTATAQERSPMAALLLDIGLIFIHRGAERLFSRDLAAALNCQTDSPWAELRKGKPIDELWLAKQLRPYGIGPSNIRDGEITAKGYTLEAFKPIIKRYVPRSELEARTTEPVQPAAPPVVNPTA
jgi:putative DNA primase/helicase